MEGNMNYFEIFKDVSVVFFIAIPPWLALRKYLKNYLNRAFLTIFFITYIIATLLTQNVFPFILVVLCFYFAIKMKDNFEVLYYLRPIKEKKTEIILYCLFFRFIIYIINVFYASLLEYVGIKVKAQDIYEIFLNAGWIKVIFLFAMTVVFAPIVEEFTFRHILYRGLSKKIGKQLSAALTSFLFALIHYNLAGFVSFFGIGIYNCYLYEKYGYRAAVVNHFIFNFISVLLILLIKIFNIPTVMT
ncbi:CPBP family intramembrane metalloprotease [Caloramator sp. E03]|uniref:CPBP family intramembrane glutamic endopeptidase n=1 Tax=Caloramator sp. E03 TaxID=2576307 RepID=UPI0011108710|nr:type II CAAX endopeptidase family protein [Caloramator sp. E03]QCX33071.1 CPBP family intramembrane metalloprotease [Caloramator sp. E03]